MDIDLQIKYSRALQEVQRERNALRAENERLNYLLIKSDNKIQVLEKQRNNYRHKRNEYRKQLKPIKQQLAEKEERIGKLQYELEWAKQDLNECAVGLEQKHTQDKISFAVEQIMQIIEKINNSIIEKTNNSEKIVFNPILDWFYELDNIFDNQIKQLEEGK